MSQKLWIAYETPVRTYGPTRVSIQGCEYVDDILKEIKKEFAISVPASHLTLYQPDGTTEIKVGGSPSDYLEGNTDGNPLVVKTTAVGKSTVTTRKMSAEASCRIYLDALAYKLSTYYVFRGG